MILSKESKLGFIVKNLLSKAEPSKFPFVYIFFLNLNFTDIYENL